MLGCTVFFLVHVKILKRTECKNGHSIGDLDRNTVPSAIENAIVSGVILAPKAKPSQWKT